MIIYPTLFQYNSFLSFWVSLLKKILIENIPSNVITCDGYCKIGHIQISLCTQRDIIPFLDICASL